MIFEPIHFSWRFLLNTAYTLEAIASLHISFHPNSKKIYQRYFGTKVQMLITQIFGSGNFCKIGASLLVVNGDFKALHMEVAISQ